MKLFLLLELAIASFRKFTCNSFRIVCYEFLNRIVELALGNKIFLFPDSNNQIHSFLNIIHLSNNFFKFLEQEFRL